MAERRYLFMNAHYTTTSDKTTDVTLSKWEMCEPIILINLIIELIINLIIKPTHFHHVRFLL